jgi:hypothetical protein
MPTKAVLAIGLDPAFADFSAMPGLTPEMISAYIEAQMQQVRALGFEVESCLIDLGETAEQTVQAALQSRTFDCVMIGAGLRQPPAQLLLFERVLNLIHQMAPEAKIAFNSTPADTAVAVLRWVQP